MRAILTADHKHLAKMGETTQDQMFGILTTPIKILCFVPSTVKAITPITTQIQKGTTCGKKNENIKSPLAINLESEYLIQSNFL